MNQDEIQALEFELQTVLTAEPQDLEACISVLERAIVACDADPEAARILLEAHLHDDLSECYHKAGRYDDAIVATRRAIELGWMGWPDGRCRVAELLMRAGRVEEARPLWDEVRADMPDEVGVYSNAGREYQAIGSDDEALPWLTAGLELALESRDPDWLVDQLIVMRGSSLRALGRPDRDELQGRAAAFVADRRARVTRRRPTSVKRPRPTPSIDDVLARGAGLSADALERRVARSSVPALPPTRAQSVGPPEPPVKTSIRPAAVRLALAWFPADQFARALDLWPQLTEEGVAAGVTDHAEYCRAMERTLRHYAQGETFRPAIAPVRIDDFLAWCAEQELDPGDGPTRARYSADLNRDPANILGWPPSRNQPCWCGSGRKYKLCCAKGLS